eukprot:jgi/Ulvmu1/8658/UM046_0063.1
MAGVAFSSAVLCLCAASADARSLQAGPWDPKAQPGQVWGTQVTWEQAHQLGHLTELSEPVQSASGPNSVALCTTMKSENSTDVREWLQYYRWLGVDHVYLTENVAEPSPQMVGQLRDFMDDGFVTYATEAIARAQTKVYYDCMRSHYHKHNWLSFFDMDEYLVLVDRPDLKLPEFLADYRSHAGLSVHWVVVGPSGQERRPAAGGVLRHYGQCSGHGSPWMKTIANTFFLTNIAYHPHNFEFRDDRLTVDEDHETIRKYTKRKMCSEVPPAISAAAAARGDTPKIRPGPGGKYCTGAPGFTAPTHPIAKIALFHYITRSREDFVVKRSRGGGTTRIRTWDEFAEFDALAQQRDGICAQPAALAQLCCPEEGNTLLAPLD